MSSVRSFLAQPKTNCFVITQGPDSNGVYYFTKEDIDSWAASESSNLSVVGSLYTVINGSFGSVVGNLNYTGTYDGRKTLIDFGKQVVIGNNVNSRLLVLRRVQFFAEAVAGGDGFEAYVVIENNTTDLAPSDWGRFTVRVARV